jgi:mannonate dehydratase
MHRGGAVYLGTQLKVRDDSDYRVWAQLGVRHVCADPDGNPHHWSLDVLNRHREMVEKFGLVLDMVQLPMNSRPIEEQESPDVLTAGPDRDRQLDSICALIERLAKAGIPAAKYNLNIIGIPRTKHSIGRGGSRNESFRWAEADQNAKPGIAGVVDPEENWARIEYFLKRVVPVATANKVRLACHPHDPYTPPGWKGVTRVLGTVDGLKRFVETEESPYHGLNFCQGTIAEMLDDPAKEVGAVIEWFGRRGKIFNVHFRNIRGRKLDFMETFPDEGDMDMPAALRLYRDAGYKYMIMPDHVPIIDGKDPQGVAFAYCYGYIAALLQTLDTGNRAV